ncbi:MAG: penicillin-binding protein 2 [Armatimonadetes bacterium]|nr:penicillin-binding protein 2 [Armatimonadota bacterium]
MRRDSRLELVEGFYAVFLAAVLCRLFWVQVWVPEKYNNPTGVPYHRETRLAAGKGEIADLQGRILARCVKVSSVAADPQMVADPAAAARVLAAWLPVGEARLCALLSGRWRRVMLRRDVTGEVVDALHPLLQSGVLSLTRELSQPTYSVYLYPRQLQPSPSERADLALVLGQAPTDLEALLGSSDEVVRLREPVDEATQQRLQRLGLAGLVVRQNPRRTVPTIWLEPVEQAVGLVKEPVEETVRDPGEPPEYALVPRLRQGVWEALEPLWKGVARPRQEVVEERLQVPFVYLARQLPTEVGEAVKRAVELHQLAGVWVADESRRDYPQGALAHALLGRCDVDEVGISGLERALNQVLSGVDGYTRRTIAKNGWPIVLERDESVPPVHGRTVQLTVDAYLQSVAEKAVQGAVDQFDADWGVCVVVEPATGEVRALVNVVSSTRKVPDYNRCLCVAYEPGSIAKPVVVSGALDGHLASPREGLFCSGTIQVGRTTLHCIDRHLDETVAEAVRDSCNSVMVQVGQRLGREGLERAFRNLGLFDTTGLGGPREESVGVIHPDFPDGGWSAQKVATVSYGKGVQCTAVELARAYCALANGGQLPRLRLVKRILGRDGRVLVDSPPEPGPQVLTHQTGAELRAMLRSVVADPHGTGALAASKLYDFGGKTGTSIGYHEGDPRVVSFVGFGPYNQPKLLCLISVSEPRLGSRWGATTCGAAFREVMERSLDYLGVPPNPPAGGTQ